MRGTFSVIHENATPGAYGSREMPSPYLPLSGNMKGRTLLNSDEILIPLKEIRVAYDYPFGKCGSTPEEIECGSFIFVETTSNERGFTAESFYRAVSNRYISIYAEEEAQCGKTGNISERLLNRASSNGKYAIWGHHIGDLDLHGFRFDEKRNLYFLNIDS